MNYFKLHEGYCPITGWTYFDTPKDHAKYKKQKRDDYRKKKAEKSVVVAMYEPELKAIIVNS